MTKKRIFIAINLSEKVRKRLKEYREKHDNLPVRWTKIPSLHLTLVFIGYVDNEQMLEACKIAREVASETDPFFINFKRIMPGPANSKAPRMIWLEGGVSQELADLKKKLEQALLSRDAGLQKIDSKAFSPHITLARIKSDEGRKLLMSDINSLNSAEEKFEVQFGVDSIEVMESGLKFDGAEYATLESCPLGE